MNCDNCQSNRIVEVSGKCSDLCLVKMGEKQYGGYAPDDMVIGTDDGDYLEFNFCLNCGKIQGQFPLETTKLEKGESYDDVEEQG